MSTRETFTVESTDADRTGAPRETVHSGPDYFRALDAFRTAAVRRPGSRFILCAQLEGVRSRVLEDSSTDNVSRLARGLEAVRPVLWSDPAPFLELDDTREARAARIGAGAAR